ncbi:glycosyltransferase [Accumulibacter sp.]|uniref:glycosyltransferase n=1 Tax=Accumulibacter sp. TaxID=2053492 RepID=UPI0025EC5E8A|nr:glycosyltransferase [Accumulibacter sp.]MCM8612121.1 glycosyltransferase [Accumulibacter sp.]MCM8635787.1 glycosyltransferase [Accumulibacter sp.]MCM8639576.1 glycosyltransferase [Accumulibacter sp.]
MLAAAARQGRESDSILMLTADRQIDRRILLQADSLGKAGWRVTILAMKDDDTGRRDDSRVVRVSGGGSGGLEERVADGYRRLAGWLPMNGSVMRTLKRLAWRFVVDQETFHARLYSDAASRFTPQVVVAHDLPMLPVASQVARACAARLVYDSHELYSEQEFSARERKRWAEIEARYIGHCDAVMTINESIAHELRCRHALHRVHVISNAERATGAPPRSRRFHQRFGLPATCKLLLFQGGLSENRNLQVLVQGMRHVTNPDVALVILGDGALQQRLMRDARSLPGAQRVFFHPAVPQCELLAHTGAADAGVIPYQATCLNNHFCTPNKLFEFIAAGIPILGSDLPEIRSMITGRGIGLVGDMSSPRATASLIDDLFADEARLSAWRDNLQQVRRTVCWEAEEGKLIAIYEALR